MKRLFLFSLLFLVVASTVFATVYRSNALGQKFEEEEHLFLNGYELEFTENTENLYENGTVILSRLHYSDGYEEQREGVVERVFTDEEGKPTRRILTRGSQTEEYNYFYEGHLLASYNYAVDGTVCDTVRYLRTSDGRLLGFENKEGLAFLVSPDYVYETDGETIRISSFGEEAVLPEREVTELEDGGYIEVVDHVRRTYDGNGRLTTEEADGVTTSYLYDRDGTLQSMRTEDGVSVMETLYEDGKAMKTLEYDVQGTLKTVSTVLADGFIEEIRYIDGVPRYRFVYDRDGRRIREASGL